MRQRIRAFPFLIFVSSLLLLPFYYSYSDGFYVNTTTYVDGDLSIDMDTAQGRGSRLDRYELELDSRDGATLVTNVFQAGETQVDIDYVGHESDSLLKPRLASKEKIGVDTCNSSECRQGVAGSTFDVQVVSSSSQGSFNEGKYDIDAQGVGKFGVAVAEHVSTPSASVYEKNKYELKGEGDFALSGEYGFRGDVQETSGSLGNPAIGSPTTSENSGPRDFVLSISGPTVVEENTTVHYSASLTFSDETAESVAGGTTWSVDSPYASVDSNGSLTVSEVTSDEAVTITASYTHLDVTETAERVVTIIDTNLPPSKPAIASPHDGQTDCELQLQITTEPFSDPEGDPHGQTHWQISRNADFNPAIIDFTSTQQLTGLVVPDMFLEANTTYYVRVRFYDIFLEPSEWSQTIVFTTGAEPPPPTQFFLSVGGPRAIDENTVAEYAALVTFGDGTTETVTEDASWGESSSYASIDSNGVLSASEVTNDETVTITAFYTYEGITEIADKVVTILDTNLPPSKPAIASPYDGQTDCELQLQITAQPFSDPEGDGHGQSQWQISKHADFTPTVIDVTSAQQLTELIVPDMFLESGITYYVRVRFYDIFLEPSEWSDSIAFITAAEESDVSGNVLPDEKEMGNDVVLDGDQIADSKSDGILHAADMEVGEVTVDANWRRVEYRRTFFDPIIIAKALSCNEEDPAVIRIRHVGSTGFEIRVQEWDYLDDLHSEETVGYVVMEAGSYALPDGILVEAGRFETSNMTIWPAISFHQPFNDVPVVIATITTFNESDAVTGRIRNITTAGFEFLMQEQEQNAQEHAAEEICFIAWEPSSGTVGGLPYEVNRTQDKVDDEFRTLPFTELFTTPPVFIADMQTAEGLDPANVRSDNRDLYGVDIRIVEEQSHNDETKHSNEAVGYVVLSNGD